MIAIILQFLLQFKEYFVLFIAAIGTLFFIKREQKKEIKNRELEAKINEVQRTEKAKNNFNDLDDSEQSDWLLNDLEKRRNKLK